MELETERLLLRPWRESDAADLYEYAKDPRVGPVAGWPPHTSVENSREMIRRFLSGPETYAVVRKATGQPVGSIGLELPGEANVKLGPNECELGYWIGVPYWGQGLIPEAARALLARGFETLGMETIWCGYFEGNQKSRRVQEKLGFQFHHMEEAQSCAQLAQGRRTYVSRMTRAEWEIRNTK